MARSEDNKRLSTNAFVDLWGKPNNTLTAAGVSSVVVDAYTGAISAHEAGRLLVDAIATRVSKAAVFLPSNTSNEIAVAMRNTNGGATACSYSVHQAKALLQTPYLVPAIRNSVYAEAYQLASVTGASAQAAMFTTPQNIDADPQPNERLRAAYENVAGECFDHGLDAIKAEVFGTKSTVPTLRGALQVAMQATQTQQQQLRSCSASCGRL